MALLGAITSLLGASILSTKMLTERHVEVVERIINQTIVKQPINQTQVIQQLQQYSTYVTNYWDADAVVYSQNNNYYAETRDGTTICTGSPTACIQEAIDYVAQLGGGKVFIRGGTYTVSTTIQVKSNVVLEGEGIDITVLKASSPSFGTVIDIDSQSNVAVRRLTIDKGGTQGLSDNWHNMGLSCENSNFVLVEEVKVQNTPNYAMVFGGRKDAGDINNAPYVPCNNVVVRRCRIINSYKDGIHFFGGSNIVVKDNYFEHLVDDAIAFGADQNYPVSNVLIKDNIVKNSAFQWTNGTKLHSGWNKASTPASGIFSNIVITGNIFVEVAQYGFIISLENPDYPVPDMAQNIIVENNVFKNAYINSAKNLVFRGNSVGYIVVSDGATYVSAYTGASNILIEGNTVGSITVKSSSQTISYVVIRGNIVSNNINIGGDAGTVTDIAIISNFVGDTIAVPGYPGTTSGTLKRIAIVGNVAKRIDINSPAQLVTVVGNTLFPGSDNNVRVAGLSGAPPTDVVVAFNVADGGGADWNNFIAGYEGGAKVASRVLFIGNIGRNAKNYVVASNPNCTEIYMMFNHGDKSIQVLGDVKLFRNPIYKTETSGVATISAGSTRVTVSHGLATTPSKVLITPLAQPPGKIWVENITSTSFDIVTDTAPTSNLNVAWYAEV